MADRVGVAVLTNGAGAGQRRPLERKPPLGGRRRERLGERLLHLHERNTVLRTLRAGEARHDAAEVERQPLGELGSRGGVGAEHPLLLHVPLDERHLLRRAAREPQVGEGFVVDRKEAHRGAVFRSHVGDRGPVGERHPGEAAAEELDELPNHALLPQDLGDGEHEVSRGGTRRQVAGEFEADHLRQEQRECLAEHHRFGLDAPHAPANHAKTIDHRRVAISADECVGDGHLRPALPRVIIAKEHAAGEVFEVHLMHDADRRRHHAEVAEGLLAPAEKGIPLGIAAKLDVDVLLERVVRAEEVDLHRVVDDEVDRHERIDLPRIAAKSLHGGPHGGEIDHAGHAREVLEHHARRLERDLLLSRLRGVPRSERANVALGHLVVVARSQQRLEDHPDRVRQPRRVRHPSVVEGSKAVQRGRPRAGLEGGAGGERVGGGCGHGGRGF